MICAEFERLEEGYRVDAEWQGYGNANIFEAGYIIEMKKTEYLKIGSKWKENAKSTKEVDYIHYCNVFDAVYFFKNLGGYERTIKAYTVAGYIPIQQISISPDKTQKSVYSFYIHR